MRKESEIHAHVPAERADLFEAENSDATESEYLDLLYGLVRVQKPAHCLETGTHTGTATRRIDSALCTNGFGDLITLEQRPDMKFLTSGRVTGVTANSLEYINTYTGPKFDFVFLDSHIPTRPDELRALLDRDMLADDALIAIHDSSGLRTLPGGAIDPQILEFWDKMDKLGDDHPELEDFTFHLSRGMMVLRYGVA